MLDEFQRFAEFDSNPKLRGTLEISRAAVDARGRVSYVVRAPGCTSSETC